MKFLILLFFLVNGIIGEYTIEPKYEKCESWKSLFDSTEFHIDEKCCNSEGFVCANGNITSIDITINSGGIDMTKLPTSTNLEKFSIKGDIYNGVVPIQLLNSNLYKILDLSNSNITKIPSAFEENDTIEEIYLNNNQIKEFPYQFAKMKNLKILNLENNDFENIHYYYDYCEYFYNINDMKIIPKISLGVKDESILDLYAKCNMEFNLNYNDDDHFDGLKCATLIIFLSFLIFASLIMICTYKNSASTHEDYLTFRNEISSRQELDILPRYNDIVNNNNNYNIVNNRNVINISENPPNYTEIDNNVSSQNENHLPTYEETIDNAVSSN